MKLNFDGVQIGEHIKIMRFTKSNKPRIERNGTVIFKNNRMITVKFHNGAESFTLADVVDKTIEFAKGVM